MLSMKLVEMRGGYLYQHRPDVIPQGFMTDDEMALWSAYYERKAAEAKQRG
ncbi:MAG: hypothetical protein RLZZ524_655 [Pseudomonadota bacterium]|jgi:hypothetical protein